MNLRARPADGVRERASWEGRGAQRRRKATDGVNEAVGDAARARAPLPLRERSVGAGKCGIATSTW